MLNEEMSLTNVQVILEMEWDSYRGFVLNAAEYVPHYAGWVELNIDKRLFSRKIQVVVLDGDVGILVVVAADDEAIVGAEVIENYFETWKQLMMVLQEEQKCLQLINIILEINYVPDGLQNPANSRPLAAF